MRRHFGRCIFKILQIDTRGTKSSQKRAISCSSFCTDGQLMSLNFLREGDLAVKTPHYLTNAERNAASINTTYKAIGKSILNYCAPIWTPTLADIHWKDLQTAQNAALRTATGCVNKTDIGHLHTETSEHRNTTHTRTSRRITNDSTWNLPRSVVEH